MFLNILCLNWFKLKAFARDDRVAGILCNSVVAKILHSVVLQLWRRKAPVDSMWTSYYKPLETGRRAVIYHEFHEFIYPMARSCVSLNYRPSAWQNIAIIASSPPTWLVHSLEDFSNTSFPFHEDQKKISVLFSLVSCLESYTTSY